VGFLKLDAGAVYAASGPRLFYGLAGAGVVVGSGEGWQAESAIEVKAGESVRLQANAPAELLFIGLPRLN